jgi:ABC-type amino acid transport substrate-binding protein
MVATHAKVVRVATTEWPPYALNVKQGQGSSVEIIRKAFTSMGYEVEFLFLPWVRALNYVKIGRVDAIAPIYWTQDREELYLFSNPFQESSLVLCQSKDAKDKITNKEELIKYKLGLIRGYKNTGFIDSNDNLTKIFAPTDRNNIKKLIKGRVDVIAIDKDVANYLIKSIDGDISIIDPPLDVKKLYLGFSKAKESSKTISDDFNKGLKKIGIK